MVATVTHTTPADASFSATGETEWERPHTLVDVASLDDVSAALAASQPLDADLTAIAALTTTAYGLAFLELANSAAARAALALGTAATQDVSAFDVAGAAAAALAASQPLDSDLTAIAALTTTSYGRSFLALADAAAGRTALGLGSMAEQAASAVALTGGTAILTSLQTPTINGGTAANDDITIQGTTNATRTTSYVNLQPNGGSVGIGNSAPVCALDVSGKFAVNPGNFFSAVDSTAQFVVSGTTAPVYINLSAETPFYLRGNTAATAGVTGQASVSLRFYGARWNGSSSVSLQASAVMRPSGSIDSSKLCFGFTDNDDQMLVITHGTKVGIGQPAPTAVLHLKAGTATANSAPLKLTAGTNLTTVENGVFEYDGTNLYFSTGGVRKTVTLV